MVVTDCWKVHRHHLPSRHPHKQIEILGFGNKLAKDMLDNGFSKQAGGDQVLFIPTHAGLPADSQSAVSSLGDLSPPTAGASSRRGATSFSETALSEVAKLRQIEAAIGRHKHLVVNGRREISGGTQRIARSRCKICRSKTKWQCAECEAHLCARKLNGQESACIVNHLESVRSEFESDLSP
jgi:hypothetical protein